MGPVTRPSRFVARRLQRAPRPTNSLRCLERCSLRYDSVLQISPERNDQLARQSDQRDSTHAARHRAHTGAVPACQGAAWLMPQPEPRQLDSASPRPRVARPGDALVASDAPTLPGDRDEAQVAADLTAVVEAAIVHLVRQHAGERRSDAAHSDQLAGHRAVLRDHLVDLALHLGEHLLDQPQSATFALDLSLRPRRQGLAFGRPNRVETLFPIPLDEPVIAHAVQDQQPFDAGDMALTLVQQPLALAAAPALVLLSDLWHTHDTAHLFLPAQKRH